MEGQEGPAAREEDILAINPRAINVAEFAGARAAELKTMTEAVMTMGGMRRTFQKLPRHLRRRAMSHDLRRLPKRLRDSEERTMQKSMHKKKAGQGKEGGAEEDLPPAKRSRRHRRRPSNLKAEYQRRQGGHAWLETHIWHAKRFKMVGQWGYKLPLHPSDKSIRATYRAMARHCLLQDVSYLRVVEMSGPQGLTLRALSRLTSPSTGLTCAAAAFLSGQRHGEAVFYRKDQFPQGAIGPVQFLWKAEATLADSVPKAKGESQEGCEAGMPAASPGGKFEEKGVRKLWLWAHPSCASELLKELKAASEAENANTDSNSRVTVTQLKDSPLRFRLQGPLSHPVLLHALKMSDVGKASGPEQPRLWWEDYYADLHHLQAWREQSSTWETLGGVRTAMDLPPRCVLGLTVRDPRNLLPIKRTKIMTDPNELVPPDKVPTEVVRQFPNAAPVSPLWEKSVRTAVTSTQIPTHKLNRMRSEMLVPGQELSLDRQESRVPILLLQQPGRECSAAASHKSKGGSSAGFGGGWDIVLPSGWGMAFWIALILRGARVAGLRELRSCHLQQGVPFFPDVFPDTAAGEEWADKLEQELTKKFKSWPPAKRPNYGKLGVVSPFKCPWKKLLKEWRDIKKSEEEEEEDIAVEPNATEAIKQAASDIGASSEEKNLHPEEDENQTFFVLRDRTKLEKLSESLGANLRPLKMSIASTRTKPSVSFGAPIAGILKDIAGVKMHTTEAANGHAASQASSAQSKDAKTGHHMEINRVAADLIQDADRVLVGVRLSMANRGVPRQFAMICLPSEEDFASFKSDQRFCPREPIHREFKLPKTPKKKKNKKKKGQSVDDNPRDGSSDEVRVKDEVASNVKLFKSCRRQLIGFVMDGANAFISGSGQAVGYCCMLGLLRLIEERPQGQTGMVLVRDTKAVQYRFAFLDVI
ncbi:ribonucleases P/MRP protein subunit POP1-like [Acanthaster planci]|uniref:Ribonucleases P/MRP protein subunit POP1-like n=1 Tax=Acanthaster planci TaxID=133434 RepID=A0A8B7Y7J8_ACAPL|nr:ribonucleases P/MRP protein subunit POP1-like [Acanthaster planci]XP_022089207.1 ribonucleases P/MRP protein subunit POP1-like [Acanthaster planci]